jgi:hypothetical protein
MNECDVTTKKVMTAMGNAIVVRMQKDMGRALNR